MSKRKIIQKVNAYLDGAMSAAERANFEKALQTDHGLKEEFEIRKQMMAFLRTNRKGKARSELKKTWQKLKEEGNVHDDHFSNQETRRIDLNRLKSNAIKIAASLAAAGLFLSQFSGPFNAQKAASKKEEDKKKKKK